MLKILGFLRLFLTRVLVKKFLLVQSAFSAALVGCKIFEKILFGVRIRNFSHFLCQKNDLFFDFWTPLIFGPKAQNFFLAISLKALPEKKLDFRFEIFHIFYAKKTTFFSIFRPPLFSGRRPEKKIGILLIFLHRKI